MSAEMEETLILDYEQHLRFPWKDLEEAYMMYLSGTLANDNDHCSSKSRQTLDSVGARETSNDEQVASSDNEGNRHHSSSHGRPRRNTSSSGRRRKRTEGEDSIEINEANDVLNYDLAHHCKFPVSDLETRYLMYLSGTLSESSAGKPTNFKNNKVRSQRSHERSSKSSEKSGGRRHTPTEERKVSPTDFEDQMDHMDQRNGYRNRFRGKPRGVSYARTPYQGNRRCCGEFHCPRCFRHWMSANSRANKAQPCNGCGLFVYPHSQWPLTWMPMPMPMDGGPMTWDELEDQENRHDQYPEPPFDKEGMKLGGNDRRPGYRSRRPLRPHHRRRREQEV